MIQLNRVNCVLRNEGYNVGDLIKAGTDNQPAGKYREVGPRGGKVKNPRTVEIKAGDRLPPTQKSGSKWERN